MKTHRSKSTRPTVVGDDGWWYGVQPSLARWFYGDAEVGVGSTVTVQQRRSGVGSRQHGTLEIEGRFGDDDYFVAASEQALEAAIKAGVIKSVQDFVDSAIAQLPRPLPSTFERAAQATNLVDLFEPARGLLTDEEVDTLFARNRMPSRLVDLR